MEALKDPINNLADEQGISAGEKARMLALEEEIKMIVGRAAESKKEMDSKIQTFLQQSTKARESVAVCKKIENDLDSMEAELRILKSQIMKFQEQLAAVEKRQSDVTRDYDSLMTELEPLHAELQSLKDTNLEEQKARIEEEADPNMVRKNPNRYEWKMPLELVFLGPTYPGRGNNHNVTPQNRTLRSPSE